MKTAVVILNWNTRNYLEDFLAGLIHSTEGLDAGVWVADNASTDGSADYAASLVGEDRVIRFDTNLGFTGGYNKALAMIQADYFVLINSDVKVEDGWLQPLCDWMDRHPECAACGPKLHMLERHGETDYIRSGYFEYAGAAGGYIDRFGYPFCRGRVLGRTEEDTGRYDSPAAVLWVSGACMMVRRSVWESIGGLDERFFAHMEEIDWCWRAGLKGYNINVIPESTVWHLGGGTLPAESPFKLKLNYRNNILLLENNLAATIGPKRARIRICCRKILDCAAMVIYFVTGRKENSKAVLEARREADELKRKNGSKASVRVVRGYFGLCIIPISIIFGKRIFKYLKRYEDRH